MNPFWLKPRWLVAHASMLAFVVGCGFLARWQFDRLDERRERNRLIAGRSSSIVELEDLAPKGTGEEAELRYRRVRVSGTYDTARQVVLVGRGLHGRPGVHVLTPLRTDQGYALIVVRGWVPLSAAPLQQPEAGAPSGRVQLEGVLLPNERGLGSRLSTSEPPSMSKLNVAAIAPRIRSAVFPLAMRLTDQDPAGAGPAPEIVPGEPLNDGPHLSYAVQWILFALVATIGWFAFVRHAARQQARRHDRPEHDTSVPT